MARALLHLVDRDHYLLIFSLYLLSFCFKSLSVLERRGCIFTFDLIGVLGRDNLISCALMILTLMILFQLSDCLFEQCQIFLLFIIFRHRCRLLLLL